MLSEQEKQKIFTDLDAAYELYYDNNRLGLNQSGQLDLRRKTIGLAGKMFFNTSTLPSMYLEEKFPQKRNEEILRTIRSYEESDRT